MNEYRCVSIYEYIYIYIYIYVCVCFCIEFIDARLCVERHICEYVLCVPACIYSHIYIYMHIYIYVYTYVFLCSY